MKLVLYTLGAAAAATAAAGSTAPEQVHIALAGQDVNGDATGFSFAWFTEDPTAVSSVEYTVANVNASNVVNGTASQYLEGYGYHHVAKVFGIPPDTSVTYRVGSSDGGWSENFTTTTPPPKDAERTVKLSVFGDMGYADSNIRPMAVAAGGLQKNWSATFSRQVLERLKDNGEIDAVWHLGDIGYADDAFGSFFTRARAAHCSYLVNMFNQELFPMPSILDAFLCFIVAFFEGHDPLKFLYEEAYNGYMNWLQNLTTTLPYMVLPGNHESECHSPYVLADEKLAQQLANFSAYNTRWAMPSEESHGSFKTNMWYSFNYGPVHFVSSNTETDFKGAGEEHTGDGHFPWLKAGGFGADGEYQAWLEADLKVNRKKNQLQRGYVSPTYSLTMRSVNFRFDFHLSL